MIAKQISRQSHEIIHWLWLWTLAAIAVSVLYVRTHGHQPSDRSTSIPIEEIVDARPIPIPNVDDPDQFRFPYPMNNPNDIAVADVLRLNRAGDYQRVIKAWQNLRMMEDSVTWKQVGLGVAYLRLEEFDQAFKHLTHAVKLEPTNAIAEYFLGRVRREQSRDVPFWFEMNDKVPFRLAAYNQDRTEVAEQGSWAHGKSVIPPFRNPTFDVQAEHHFRRAIELAPQCDLDRTINVVQPIVQFANQWPPDRPTVRDLLISLGEANYIEKARQEIGERLTIDH